MLVHLQPARIIATAKLTSSTYLHIKYVSISALLNTSMNSLSHLSIYTFSMTPVILAPIVFDQKAEVEAVVDTRPLWILEAVSPKSSIPTL